MRKINILLGILGILLGLYLFVIGVTIGGFGGLGVVIVYPILGILLVVFGIGLLRKKAESEENVRKTNIPRAVILSLIIFIFLMFLIRYLPF